MQDAKKRLSPRWPLRVPLRLAIIKQEGLVDEEVSAETLNISQSGLFMHTHLRIKVGAPVQLSIQIPKELSRHVPLYIHCTGHVIHEHHLPDGRKGYGVRFKEVLAALHMSASPDPLTAAASTNWL